MSLRLISTVLKAAISHDLTDLATIKDELSISTADTSNDAFLNRANTQVSAAVAGYCNRIFQVETISDAYYPDSVRYQYSDRGGPAALQLSRWPLVSTITTLETSQAAASGTRLDFASTTGILAGRPVSAAGIVPGSFVSADPSPTHLDLNQAIAAAVALGAAIDFGLNVAVTDAAGTTTTLTLGTDYLIDADPGHLIRLNSSTGRPTQWGSVQALVTYQGGYSTIPADIVEAVLRMITGRFQARGRDPYLKSQSQGELGDRTYWVGNLPGVTGAMTQEVEDLLDGYRVPVIG